MLTSPVPSVDTDKHIGYPAPHSRSSTMVGNQANDSSLESNSDSDVDQECHEPTPPPPSAVTWKKTGGTGNITFCLKSSTVVNDKPPAACSMDVMEDISNLATTMDVQKEKPRRVTNVLGNGPGLPTSNKITMTVTAHTLKGKVKAINNNKENDRPLTDIDESTNFRKKQKKSMKVSTAPVRKSAHTRKWCMNYGIIYTHMITQSFLKHVLSGHCSI